MYMVYILMLCDNRRLEALIRPGVSVALSDGAGLPAMVLPALNDAAARAGGVRLFLGWPTGARGAISTWAGLPANGAHRPTSSSGSKLFSRLSSRAPRAPGDG